MLVVISLAVTTSILPSSITKVAVLNFMLGIGMAFSVKSLQTSAFSDNNINIRFSPQAFVAYKPTHHIYDKAFLIGNFPGINQRFCNPFEGYLSYPQDCLICSRRSN